MPTTCEWIEVNHWPPDSHKKVLASFEEFGERRIVIAESWVDREGRRVWHQDSEWVEAEGGWDGAVKIHENLPVTHWSELPAPPR